MYNNTGTEMRILSKLAVVSIWLSYGILFVAGCAVPAIKSRANVTSLPDNAAELTKYADEIYVKSTATADGGSVEMENALQALDKAVTLDPGSYEAVWKAARACAWLAEDAFDDDKTRCAHFSGRGSGYAKAALKLDANAVEGHYYSGINRALEATTKLFVTAKFMVPSIRDTWKRAMQIDPTFDHGGPARALGSLYTHAPPWPASIGDPELGAELLSKALNSAPDYAQNSLFMGDALLANEKFEEARQQYQKVLDAPSNSDNAHFLSRWKQKAQKGLGDVAKKLQSAS